MKKYFWPIFLMAIGLIIYMVSNKQEVPQLAKTKPTPIKTPIAIKTQPKARPTPTPLKEANKAALQQIQTTQTKSEEEQSFQKLSDLLHLSIKESVSSLQLRDTLTKLKLSPISSKDTNPHTGTMSIVRTQKTLPGTRYFHAQFFEDENGASHLQHMSFEFKPGPDAMDKAIQMVQSSFNLNRGPDFKRKDFVSWNLPDSRIIWVQKMQSQDLKDNPFNAYTIKDIGTIRVAVELEIHQGGMDGHIGH